MTIENNKTLTYEELYLKDLLHTVDPAEEFNLYKEYVINSFLEDVKRYKRKNTDRNRRYNMIVDDVTNGLNQLKEKSKDITRHDVHNTDFETFISSNLRLNLKKLYKSKYSESTYYITNSRKIVNTLEYTFKKVNKYFLECERTGEEAIKCIGHTIIQ